MFQVRLHGRGGDGLVTAAQTPSVATTDQRRLWV
jgi:Pyruvate/2-oxoacid:ferredoxin oxidoreductase gamma subunit